MAQIEIRNLRKKFDKFVAVENSSFTINNNEFFVMLGPSGCGKTTTLRMIAGLEYPTAGEILLDGKDVTYNRASKRDIAFVFQLFALYPHMNVYNNISFPLRVGGYPKKVVRRRTEEAAKMLKIDHLLNKKVSGLSSGDRQRTSLGRAIVRDAKAYLMDEPLGALDAQFREFMCEELIQLHNRIEATTVYVTHDQIEAMHMADRICVMNNGKILQIGTPMDIYAKPATKFVGEFIGSPSMNFINASGKIPVGATEVKVIDSRVPIPKTLDNLPTEYSVIGARPEHITITNDGHIRGEVFAVENIGSRQMVSVETRAGKLMVRAPNTLNVSYGENVGLNFDSEKIVVFNPDTDEALKSVLFQ